MDENDTDFKANLDRYKYPQRFPGGDSVEARDKGLLFLRKLTTQLNGNDYLLGQQVSFVDIAVFPFIRQFANTDVQWFTAQDLPGVQRWLDSLVNSVLFKTVMEKNRCYLL